MDKNSIGVAQAFATSSKSMFSRERSGTTEVQVSCACVSIMGIKIGRIKLSDYCDTVKILCVVTTAQFG